MVGHSPAPHGAGNWGQAERRFTPGSASGFAGTARRISPSEGNLEVDIRLRSQVDVSLKVDRLINCTGSEEDYRRSPNPLLRSLLESGRIQASPIGKGLLTDRHGALIDSQGTPSDWLYTLGPPEWAGCSRQRLCRN